MEVCRICLSSKTKKHVKDLFGDNDKNVDVIHFCLGIEISENETPNPRLCSQCFKKIIQFSEFKTLAQKNDYYFKTNNNVLKVELEKNYVDEIYQNGKLNDFVEVKNEEEELNDVNYEEEVWLDVIKGEESSDSSTDSDIPLEDLPKIKVKHKIKKGIRQYQVCEECGKPVRNLKEHLATHKPKEKNTKKFPCNSCDKEFAHYSGRRKHILSKHKGFKYHCKICNKDIVSLWSHNQAVHRKIKPFTCKICGKGFLSRSPLAEHLIRHEKEKPFECGICDVKLSTMLSLKSHIRRVHEKERTHICEYCSKTFFTKDALLVHIRCHTKEKPYKCEECGKSFPTSTQRKRHWLVHTGEKKYKCPHCDMEFARNGNLRKHIICHTRVKNYPCKYCGVSFYRTDHRKRHEFTAHEKINALCSEVKDSFIENK